MRKIIVLFCIMALFFTVAPKKSFAGKTTYYTLTVSSSNPGSGILVSVSPNDRFKKGNGTTQFKRYYLKDTDVTLTAPLSAAGNVFQKWKKGSSDYSTNRSATVKMTANTSMTAVYTSQTDTTPPVTTVSPAGGVYTAQVTVTLLSNEPATTYYCTGAGCNPASVYSSSLTFSASTTLRYYSKDPAGNTEAIKEMSYTIQSQQACTPGPVLPQHAGLTWTGSYTICQSCHAAQVDEVHASAHYQWKGAASEMVNGQPQQGKIIQRDAGSNILPGTSAMNAYCINILGNFNGCGACHIGLGAGPTATNKDNIDCLLCHQKYYKRKKVNGVFQPDTANMCIDMNTALQTLHKPTRDNCLQCHASGGGGDNFKRGDLAMAHKNTTDTAFDNHMATTGGNLVCQACHTTTEHKIAGRGTDLRPSDSSLVVTCYQCHSDNGPHESTNDIGKHTARVACQTCHIPVYAKNAADTAATEATEIHRDWTAPEWNAGKSRWEPTPTKANDLKPEYAFWDGTSWGYNLKDAAVLDPATGNYQISRPMGGINTAGSLLYPFKYKTAKQPYVPDFNVLIAIDTAKYWSMPVPPYTPTQADIAGTIASGLSNMGYSPATPFTWVTTDEFQLITHEVPKASGNALTCTKCHVNSTATQMKLVTDIGYSLKKPASDLCNDCHSLRSYDGTYSKFIDIHNKHVGSRRYDCSRCHNFSRPERGLQ